MNLLHGDCREVMATLGIESIDAIVTDPPYGLEFMGKEWDRLWSKPDASFTERPKGGTGPFDRRRASYGSDTRAMQTWHESWAREAYRVLTPGAHLVAFGGTRTFHRLTCAIEDAGFEIRDCLSWLYGSGFPKSHNLPGGLGTALKPGWEPIVLARKPLIGTVAANVEQHGTGALNIDGCRIAGGDEITNHARSAIAAISKGIYGDSSAQETNQTAGQHLGRWPANVVLDADAAALLDATVGERKSSSILAERKIYGPDDSFFGGDQGGLGYTKSSGYADAGGPSRFFYTAKASRSERNAGLEGMPERDRKPYEGGMAGLSDPRMESEQARRPAANHHPTVKPIALMRWLVRLVTPPGGLVLDPFMGSGTTGIACALEGFDFTGIEQDAEYLAIAQRRIAHIADPLRSMSAD